VSTKLADFFSILQEQERHDITIKHSADQTGV
jgi:hypothetical protein